MKNLSLLLMLPFFAVLLVQCANPAESRDETPSENESPTAGSADNLTDIYWKLTELKMMPVSGYPAQNKTPYLMLKKEGNRAEGTGGCNSMGGSYELKADGQISFSQLISTKMACPDMMMETEYHAALEATRKYQSDGKVLTLFNEAGIPQAKFEASAPQ